MRWDAEVGVIGAGPAGARAAELLADAGREVVLVDPRVPWEKPCGGGLTPPIFEVMPALTELQSRAQRVDSARIEVDASRGFTVPVDRPVWIVSRRALSAWQLDRARVAGARHVGERVRDLRGIEGGWDLRTDTRSLRVPLLIGADGGASLVRRVAAPKMRVELAPTRVAYPAGSGPTPNSMALRFYTGVAGYLWDFPRPYQRSVGIGVPNSTWRRGEMDRRIDEYRDSSEPCSCSGLERAGAVIGTAQLGHGDFGKLAGDNYALLGDAAGLADPLSGEGIQNALRSAALFADAYLDGRLAEYPSLARAAFEREFAVSRMLRRLLLEADAPRLVAWAARSDLAWAGMAALTNAINEHDGRVTRLVWRWARSLRRVRAQPSVAGRIERIAVPCTCAADRGTELTCCAGAAAARAEWPRPRVLT